jgi:3-dehydroquinate synthase
VRANTPPQIAVIADRTVADLHLYRLLPYLSPPPAVLTFSPGEASKSLASAERLLEELAQARVGRDGVIVAFGGGVAGDLAGFVAATWLRGVRLIQVPTTLLAAVDASVGGKTAVNLAAGKNLVGAFYQPQMVIIDTDFLQTLPAKDLAAGLAESVKHAVIRDVDFLTWHEREAERIISREPAAVTELIARNCTIKAGVVSQDERESGLRAILNYGHTIGHAIEYLLGYELRHGECVALGMIAENELACGRRLLPREAAERIRELLGRFGLPIRLPRRLPSDELLAACRVDKKVRNASINFVLIEGIGQPRRVADLPDAEIAAAVEAVQPP